MVYTLVKVNVSHQFHRICYSIQQLFPFLCVFLFFALKQFFFLRIKNVHLNFNKCELRS